MAKKKTIYLIIILLLTGFFLAGCASTRHYVSDVKYMKLYTIDLSLIQDDVVRGQVEQLLSDFDVAQELIFTYSVRERLLESRIKIMAEIIKECSDK